MTGEELYLKIVEHLNIRTKAKRTAFKNIIFFKKEMETFENCEYCNVQFEAKSVIGYCLCEPCKNKYLSVLASRRKKMSRK